MITRVMIDIETLGTVPGSVFFSIGAVEFTKGSLLREFEALISPLDAQACGLRVDADTVGWWLAQGEETLATAGVAFREGLPLQGALTKLAAWLEAVRGDDPIEIWANAPSLDCALVEAGYRALRMDPPWRFWEERCYRTLKNLRRDIEMQRTGRQHVALDDARDQARHAIALLEALGCADWEVEPRADRTDATDEAAGGMLEWGPAATAGEIRGWLRGSPETTLFVIKPWCGRGDCGTLMGAFIPDSNEQWPEGAPHDVLKRRAEYSLRGFLARANGCCLPDWKEVTCP